MKLDGWIPYRIYWASAQAMVEWCYLGERRFTDPFFQMTLQTAMSHPANILFRRQTPIDVMREWYESRPGIAPTGIIFHLSRCGSTLLAQMLASLPQTIVLSEPEPLEPLLRPQLMTPRPAGEQKVDWLRWLLGALGQPRAGGEKYLFLKTEPLNLLSLADFEQAFPGIRCIFLYRDPVEVLVSLVQQPAPSFYPGVIDPAALDLDVRATLSMPPDEYTAIVLAKLCEIALRAHGDGRCRLVNYHELPEAAWTTLPEYFGIDLSPADIEQMQETAGYSAKDPATPFRSDTERKRRTASDRIRGLAAQDLDPLYARLNQA
jgi:hypothetical protein